MAEKEFENHDDDLFADLLEDFEDEDEEVEADDDGGEPDTAETDESGKDENSEEQEETEEEKRQKNKNAEEARKRREAEEKAKKEKKEQPKSNEEKLGEELVAFNKKYPDIDLKSLDEDKSFKRFISGRLLGNKNFTQLYEDFVEMKADLSGKQQNDIESEYARKSGAAPKLSSSGSERHADVYSTAEIDILIAKLPFMTDKEYAKISQKLDKSIAFHKKK